MKVKPEQAVNAVIAFKERQRIQTQKEDKIMFDQVKNRKAFDKKKEETIMKANGLKKKDLEGIRKETQKICKQSLEAFKKIKRPKKEPALQFLSRYAEPYGHGHPHPHPDPRPDPGPDPQEKDITEAICFASATGCDGNLCESQNAAIFPVFESDGVGGYFGNEASVVPADRSNSLFYSLEPAENGTATIISELLLTGVVTANTSAMVALNFFFPIGARSTADVKLSLRMNVWQGNTIINSTDLPVADIHCQDGDTKFQAFRDDLFLLILTTQVIQNESIVIELMAVANLTGRSHFGIAVVDFGKGQKLDNFNFGIRVPQLCVFVDSPVVNPPY